MPAVNSSDGPVAVTGASGYVGSHVVVALVKRGYTVHACLRDPNNPDKTEHLLALNGGRYPGHVELFTANLLEEGSYDIPFTDCYAVLHAGTPMAYGGTNNPRQVYDGAINGTKNVLNSVKMVPEVCHVYCATANPVEVIIAETDEGRGILGVIDGLRSKGIEGEEGIAWRTGFLRKTGYKLRG